MVYKGKGWKSWKGRKGSTGPGRYLTLFVVFFHVECTENHVWGPLGVRVMSIFVKTYICVKVELGDAHG